MHTFVPFVAFYLIISRDLQGKIPSLPAIRFRPKECELQSFSRGELIHWQIDKLDAEAAKSIGIPRKSPAEPLFSMP